MNWSRDGTDQRPGVGAGNIFPDIPVIAVIRAIEVAVGDVESALRIELALVRQITGGVVGCGLPGRAPGAGDSGPAHAACWFAGDRSPGRATICAAIDVVRAAAIISYTNVDRFGRAASCTSRGIKCNPDNAIRVALVAASIAGVLRIGTGIREVRHLAPGH